MNKLINILGAVFLSVMIISLSVNIALNFKGIYYNQTDKIETDLSEAKIKENYDAMVNYLSGKTDTLKFPSFSMSKNGEIHFMEVKNIFLFFKYAFCVSLALFFVTLVYFIKTKTHLFLKLSAMVNMITMAVLGLVTAIFPNEIFVLFHKLVFNNDFWIFDERTDPVITILPESFFITEAMFIFGFIFICSCLLFLVKFLLTKKGFCDKIIRV